MTCTLCKKEIPIGIKMCGSYCVQCFDREHIGSFFGEPNSYGYVIKGLILAWFPKSLFPNLKSDVDPDAIAFGRQLALKSNRGYEKYIPTAKCN